VGGGCSNKEAKNLLLGLSHQLLERLLIYLSEIYTQILTYDGYIYNNLPLVNVSS